MVFVSLFAAVLWLYELKGGVPTGSQGREGGLRDFCAACPEDRKATQIPTATAESVRMLSD